MNIKYIKDAPNGKAGTTDTVTDFEGSLLINLGLAEPHKPKRKSKPKKDDATDTDVGTKTDTDSE